MERSDTISNPTQKESICSLLLGDKRNIEFSAASCAMSLIRLNL